MRVDAMTERLPSLWDGKRRRYLACIVLTGLGEAACIGVGAHLVIGVVSGRYGGIAFAVTMLVLAAMAAGLLNLAERVFTERLSQSYVHQLRVSLLRRNLQDGGVRSLGVSMARATNDLTSVRSWVSMGVGPLAATVPLVIGALVILAFAAPVLTLGVALPLAALALATALLSRRTYAISRDVRRIRGRLSGHLADTILAAPFIRAAGGSRRELRRLSRRSRDLANASIARARYAGALRGAATATAGLISAAIAVIGLGAGLPKSTLVGALTVTGFLASHVRDLGRVAEYRQGYLAARRKIAPALARPPVRRAAPQRTAAVTVAGSVLATGVEAEGTVLADLHAKPGDCVLLNLQSERLERAVLALLAGIEDSEATVIVDGVDVHRADARDRRTKLGYAARGSPLARASVLRAARYRMPSAAPDEVRSKLRQVGLEERVRQLEKGELTQLRHGGEPLSVAERAQLSLVSAMLGDPPLLVIDRLDSELGHPGTERMCSAIRAYPGVVVVASDSILVAKLATHRWEAVEVTQVDSVQQGDAHRTSKATG